MVVQPPWHCLPALPSIEGKAHCHSPWHGERETEVIEEEGMSLNAPLTSQNEIDRLAEVIAPSTIFFGRKYCYRQIGDSISGRRWGSRLWSKGCVCPLQLRLQCLLMLYLSALPFLPIFFISLFVPYPYFFFSLCFFTFYVLLPHHTLPHIPLPPPSLHLTFLLFSRVSFWPFFSFDHLCEPEGENSITQ